MKKRSFKIATAFAGVAAATMGLRPAALAATALPAGRGGSIKNQVCSANTAHWLHLYYPTNSHNQPTHAPECFGNKGWTTAGANVWSACRAITQSPCTLVTLCTIAGATTSYRYYSNGDLAQVTEPSGRYTVDAYDLLGRISASTVHADGQARETQYSFSAMGKPLTVTYPAVTSPAMGSQVPAVTHTRQDTSAYDADGDLLTLTQADLTGGDPQRVTQYTYDEQGRLATQTLPSGATTSLAYDDFGDVSDRTDANGYQHQHTYNEYGNPTQQILDTSNASQANPTANCSAPAYPDSDGIGCDLVLDSRAYTAAGLLASETDAMGRTTTYGYDGNQELIHETQHVSLRAGKGGCDLSADEGGFGGVRPACGTSGSDSAAGPRRRSRSAAWLRAITHIQARGVPCGR
jgi:YD repeat-containing protein